MLLRVLEREHFVWSSLPDVEAISKGKWKASHFTNKVWIDPIVRSAKFSCYIP